MARSVAERWISGLAQTEYRFTIFGHGTTGDARKFASQLRASRDGKMNIAALGVISDLGVREMGDMVEVWSSDHAGMRRLASWAVGRGLDTSFIW